MSDTKRHRCRNIIWFGDWYCQMKILKDTKARAEPINPTHCTTECPDWQNGDLVLVRPKPVEGEEPKA